MTEDKDTWSWEYMVGIACECQHLDRDRLDSRHLHFFSAVPLYFGVWPPILCACIATSHELSGCNHCSMQIPLLDVYVIHVLYIKYNASYFIYFTSCTPHPECTRHVSYMYIFTVIHCVCPFIYPLATKHGNRTCCLKLFI